jgi:hypothetical protein
MSALKIIEKIGLRLFFEKRVSNMLLLLIYYAVMQLAYTCLQRLADKINGTVTHKNMNLSHNLKCLEGLSLWTMQSSLMVLELNYNLLEPAIWLQTIRIQSMKSKTENWMRSHHNHQSKIPKFRKTDIPIHGYYMTEKYSSSHHRYMKNSQHSMRLLIWYSEHRIEPIYLCET